MDTLINQYFYISISMSIYRNLANKILSVAEEFNDDLEVKSKIMIWHSRILEMGKEKEGLILKAASIDSDKK